MTGVPVGIISAEKNREKKKIHNKINKIILLARSKLNSIKNKISKARTEAGISYEGLKIINNEAEKYSKLKESIRMKESQRIDTERDKLREDSEWIGTDEVIKQKEKTNTLKSEV